MARLEDQDSKDGPTPSSKEIELRVEARGHLLSGRKVWTIARNGFRQMLGGAASDVIMYQFWRMYGQAMIKEMYPKRPYYTDGSMDDLRSLLFRVSEMNSWGKVGLEIKEATNEISVNFDNCSFCERSTSDRAVCYEMAGLLSGFSETMTGRTCYVSEIKCIAKGDDACKFIIRFH